MNNNYPKQTEQIKNFEETQQKETISSKKYVVLVCLSFFLGIFGADLIYLGFSEIAVLKIFFIIYACRNTLMHIWFYYGSIRKKKRYRWFICFKVTF